MNMVIDIGVVQMAVKFFYCFSKCVLIKRDSTVWGESEYYI